MGEICYKFSVVMPQNLFFGTKKNLFLCLVSVCPWSVLSSASLLSLDPEVSVESSRDPLSE